MSEEFSSILQKLERLDTLFSSSMKKVDDRNEVIKEKDKRIEVLTDRLSEIGKEKDMAINAKLELMDEITKEREETHELMQKLKKTIREQDDKIRNLRESKRTAQDTVMGASFEQDRLKKEMEEKEKQIREYEEKVASVAIGETGIFYDLEGIVDYIKTRIEDANRSLRLVVPEFAFLKQNDLIPLIEALPTNSVVNIATAFDEMDPEQVNIIEAWKNRGFYLTDFTDRNLISISVNGADVGMAFSGNERISGFFTNIGELVSIFNQAVMHGFIKGKKI